MRSWARLCPALLALVCLGCADSEIRTPEDVVVAEFDPAATPPRVPIPTDLARDPETGRIALPLPPDAPAAARELAEYLASLDAWPPATPARATFDGAIDPASVHPGSVLVLDLDTMTAIEGVTMTVDGTGRRLSLVPPGGVWPAGHRIGVAVLGGADGVRGAAGEPVVASPALFFARSAEPLVAGGILPPDRAAALEPLRQALGPLFVALETMGYPREQVALVWSFTISERSFAVFDPSSGRIPFPNDLLRDPETGRLAIPAAPEDWPFVARLKEQLNTLQGFSTLAPAFAQVDLPPGLALETADAEVVATNLPDPQVAVAGSAVIVRPGRPLEERSRYFVALTRGLADERGERVEPPLLMALLLASGPLVDDGGSVVPVLDDLEAARLEPLRAGLVAALEEAQIPRSEVILAWSYTTQPTLSLLANRAENLQAPASNGDERPMPAGVPGAHVAALRAGTFTGSRGDAVPYLLILPEGGARGAVIFQHGLGSDKTAVFAVADALAARGLAVAAMDLPLHGERAEGGRPLIDPTDLLGTRDRLIESALDLVQLSRALQAGLGGQAVAGEPAFVGVSLGGIVGAPFAAVSGGDRPVVLSTTGGSLVELALSSPTLGPDFAAALEEAGLPDDPAARALPLALAQTLLDAGDPLNYAAALRGRPVLVQVAEDDAVIPPRFGLLLARLADATLEVYDAAHAALINPSDPAFRIVLEDAVRFLVGGAP